MAPGFAAALHGKPSGLVKDDQCAVFMKRHGAEVVSVFGSGLHLRGLVNAAGVRQRGNTDGLTLGEPCVRLRALAVDPHLAGAQELLQATMAERWKMTLEPAIEAYIGFIRGDGALLDSAHESSPFFAAG
jgi:hypothetical protein